MLQNMFVGNPPGNYDRLLDFSNAVTGSLYFVPSATFLESIGANGPDAAETAAPETPDAPAQARSADGEAATVGSLNGSLNIGSLKGESNE
jgi:putative iron-dependent peroxidase